MPHPTGGHQGAVGEDQQVATWTRMLQAGTTLTEAGYLAMVTAWARAAFEQQRQQQQEQGVVVGASAATNPLVVQATRLPVGAVSGEPELDQGTCVAPEEDDQNPQELSRDDSSGEKVLMEEEEEEEEEGADEMWLPGSGRDNSPPTAHQARRRAKRRSPQPTYVPHSPCCFRCGG